MGRVETLKKIRYIGLTLMIIGVIIGLLVFGTEPLTTSFKLYLTTGTVIFVVGSLMFLAYEVFVPEFWRGEWAPGPGHEYPPE